jgi:hypothetical protein
VLLAIKYTGCVAQRFISMHNAKEGLRQAVRLGAV